MESPVYTLSFGDWIKQRRKALDLTQERLAQAVGCSVVLIRKIESEERRPSRQIAGLIAKALEVPPEERQTFIKIARQERNYSQLAQISFPDQPEQIASKTPRRNGLPMPATPFIGRDHELSTILQLTLQTECRLLTLIGPGGMGKTRLALETAHTINDRFPDQFPDGIFYISLTQLSSGAHLVSVIADHLHIRLSGTRQQDLQLLAYLQNKSLLFVLDNLEHLIPSRNHGDPTMPGIGFLSQVLAMAPGVKIIVTSRERLNLHGEWLFDLSGLPVPESAGPIGLSMPAALQYSAINLFLQHAKRVAPNFELTPENLAEIILICQLVEGLPLGIELAASWVRVLSVGEIASEISQSLDFLEATTRDIPLRHRSLRAVFDHSWALLNAEEQELLRKLSVFHGGFDRQAAEQVCGARLPDLSSLVDKSLIHRLSARRYELHELIRQYAYEKFELDLDVLRHTRDRHSHYYLALLQTKEAGLKSQAQKEVSQELVQEIDNLSAAWDWALRSLNLEDVRNSLRCLYWFYEVRGHLAEGVSVFHEASQKLKAATDPDVSLRQITGHCLAIEGWFAFRLGKFTEARHLLDTSLTLLEAAPNSLALNEARAFLGAFSYISGEYERSIELLSLAVEYGRTSGDHWLTAQTLGSLGRVAQLSGDYGKAHTLYRESLDCWELIGDLRGRTYALAFLGNIEVSLGDYPESARHLQQSLDLSRAAGDAFGMGTAYNHLGLLAHKTGDYYQSIASFEQSIGLFEGLGEQASLGWVCNNLGHSYLASGQFERGAAYLRRAMQIARDSKITPLMLDTLVGWEIIQAHNGMDAQFSSVLAGIARHPASTQSVRERVSLALQELGYIESEQGLLTACTPPVAPETLIEAALKSV